MLNRRILRVKAMQALYSYSLSKESLKKVICEKLESHYFMDPAKDDFADADLFAVRRKQAAKLYYQFLEDKVVVSGEEDQEDIAEVVQSHINQYHIELAKEIRKIEANMLGDVSNLETLYLKIILLVLELPQIEQDEKSKKDKAYVPKVSYWRYHFINNPVLDNLTKFEAFNKALIANNDATWKSELDLIRGWYRDILKKDEYLIAYQKKESPSIEEHKEVILYLYKKLVFKNEVISDYFSSLDLHWSENQPIIKSMVVKTFQDYEHDLDEPFELKVVNRNQEEDIPFFKKLFNEVIKNEKALDLVIAKKARNWEIERVALIDRIILRMAMTEMKTFQSIPVKVTINEFIEISKNYSTPKSKQFINGILDVLANELTSEGVIRKSGRGLIDNK